MAMDTVSLEEAMKLLASPSGGGGRGRPSVVKPIVDQFLASDAVFGRESYRNEAERKTKMLSFKKYIRDSGLEDKLWLTPEGHSILFVNMEKASKVEGGEVITAAFDAYKVRYANVGRKAGTSPKKK